MKSRSLLQPNITSFALYSIAGIICLYFFLSFLFFTLTSYWPGPLHDYWFEIPKIQDFFNNHLSWNELVTAHANAHRLVIPRLIFITDYVFFHGTNQLIIIVSILCKLIMLVLLNAIIKNESFKTKILLNVLFFSTVFNSINILNILNSSNVQWDLMAIFSCLSVYFYSNSFPIDKKKTGIYIALAYLFFICAFFSQGGSLPVIFVFVLIAFLNRSLIGVVSTVVFIGLVLYLMAYVFPVNDEDSPGLGSAIAMFIFKPWYVALFSFKLMSANIYASDAITFVFSAWSLFLFSIGLFFHKKTQHLSNNTLLYIACFCLLMMVFIAAFRVNFAPNAWTSNRYHPNVLLFVLAVHLNAFLLAGTLFRKVTLTGCRIFLVLACIINLWMPQYYQRSMAGDFANIVFDTQTSGLFYGPSQVSARRLVTSVHDFDKIAEADPFFRKFGFSYYANKQGSSHYVQTRNPGERLISPEAVTDFEHNCPVNSDSINYSKAEDGINFKFSTSIIQDPYAIFKTLFKRDTFYAIDATGIVTGYAYLYVDPEHYFSSLRVDGLSRSTTVKYIAEIKHNELVCRYVLNANTP